MLSLCFTSSASFKPTSAVFAMASVGSFVVMVILVLLDLASFIWVSALVCCSEYQYGNLPCLSPS